MWPGDKPGTEGTRYLGKTLNKFDETYGPYFARTHQLDSHAGTHLVPPAFSLPPDGFDNSRYDAETRGVLAKYESKFGPRGHSSVTAEKVPLEQM